LQAPLGLYGVSKTALLGLTKALAVELGADNIRVNALAPGLVRTKFAAMLWSEEAAAEASADLPPQYPTLGAHGLGSTVLLLPS
jgi:dehydrogenase/reductase SDR family protein 4